MNQDNNRRQLLWAVVILAVLFCASSLLGPRDSTPHPVASVWVDGEEVLTVNLDGAQDQEFSILEMTGKDITFQVKDHAIRFLHSDCPDKICVNTGFIREDNSVATCLPNQVVLTVTSQP